MININILDPQMAIVFYVSKLQQVELRLPQVLSADSPVGITHLIPLIILLSG